MANISQIWSPRLFENVADQSRLIVFAELVEREIPVFLIDGGFLIAMVLTISVSSLVSHPDIKAKICEVESQRVSTVHTYASR